MPASPPGSPTWDSSRLPLGLGGPGTLGGPLTGPSSLLTTCLRCFLRDQVASAGSPWGRTPLGPRTTARLNLRGPGAGSSQAPRQTHTCRSRQLGPTAPRDRLVSAERREPADGASGRSGTRRLPAWTAPRLEDQWSPHCGAEGTAEAPRGSGPAGGGLPTPPEAVAGKTGPRPPFIEAETKARRRSAAAQLLGALSWAQPV